MKSFHIQEKYNFFNCFIHYFFLMKITDSEIKPFPKMCYQTVKWAVLKALGLQASSCPWPAHYLPRAAAMSKPRAAATAHGFRVPQDPPVWISRTFCPERGDWKWCSKNAWFLVKSVNRLYSCCLNEQAFQETIWIARLSLLCKPKLGTKI